QAHRHRRLALAERLDLLRNIVFQDAEIPARDIGNEVPLVVEYRYIDADQVHIALETRHRFGNVGLGLFAELRWDGNLFRLAGGLPRLGYRGTDVFGGAALVLRQRCKPRRQKDHHYGSPECKLIPGFYRHANTPVNYSKED